MVYRLLRQKMLIGYKLPAQVGWRIIDPTPALRRFLVEPELDRVPLLSSAEVAEIVGVHQRTVQQWMTEGRLVPTRGRTKAQGAGISAAELRRFLADFTGRKGRGKKVYLKPIVDWAKAYLEGDQAKVAKVIDAIIKEAVFLPEPERSETMHRLLLLFDEANQLLRKCRTVGRGSQNRTASTSSQDLDATTTPIPEIGRR